jgi:membrane protein
MTLQEWQGVLKRAWIDIQRNHTQSFAAGLSYFFMMGLFPALIALAAIVGYLPIPDLFNEILNVMSRFVPPDSMGLVRTVVADVISPNKGKLLSFGLVGSIWAVSGGFASIMEALNVAYDVPETRPFWKTRLLALFLSVQIGALMLSALAVMLLGPQFGEWLAKTFHVSFVWAYVWPYLRIGFALFAVIFTVEVIYFAGPNVKQCFRYTLMGALVAVGTWLGLSYLLGLYFRQVVHLNKTYGSLGAVVALMIWLQWTAMSLLIGAEINSEIVKVATGEPVELKYERRKTPRKPLPIAKAA